MGKAEDHSVEKAYEMRLSSLESSPAKWKALGEPGDGIDLISVDQTHQLAVLEETWQNFQSIFAESIEKLDEIAIPVEDDDNDVLPEGAKRGRSRTVTNKDVVRLKMKLSAVTKAI